MSAKAPDFSFSRQARVEGPFSKPSIGLASVQVLPPSLDSLSYKPTEVRMGSGKGSIDFWACKVKPGRIMFEIDGVAEPIAREALRLGAMKLPVTTRIVAREDW